MSGLPAPAPIRYTDAVFDAALFVRSASPGAVLRFLERRKDAEKPAELLLSEGVGEEKWRALFAPSTYLEAVNPLLSYAFQETLLLLSSKDGHTADIWEQGEWKHRLALGGGRRTWFSFSSTRRMDVDLRAWLNEKGLGFRYVGLPTRYMTKPPKNVIDYDTVAILDQRNLLVEDSPRLYRFPLC